MLSYNSVAPNRHDRSKSSTPTKPLPLTSNIPKLRHYQYNFRSKNQLIEWWQQVNINLPLKPRQPSLCHYLPIQGCIQALLIKYYTINGKFQDATNSCSHARNQILQTQLRFAHVKDGEEEIRHICAEYMDVFKLPRDKLTSTSAIKHYIPTPTIPANRALTLWNYRIPEHHQKEVEKQIQKMLEDNIIRPSQCPWNFPILIAPKKIDASGKRKWICVDFLRLNELTVGDTFPIPNIKEILDKLRRARYFSALDCACGYWQVPMAEEDRAKTAFSTPTGHYEYLRMPFGLKSALGTFQRLMNCVFMGIIGTRCFVYLDYVITFGETLFEHNPDLGKCLIN